MIPIVFQIAAVAVLAALAWVWWLLWGVWAVWVPLILSAVVVAAVVRWVIGIWDRWRG